MRNSLLYYPVPQAVRARKFSGAVYYFVIIIAATLVIPVLTVPFVGLSLYAPLFYLVAVDAIFKRPMPWSSIGRRYKILAILIWLGIFLSMTVNGLASGGTAIDSYGAITVFRYGYWLFIFILVIYIVRVGNFAPVMTRVFGWSILTLAVLRWGEIALYGNFGAWSGTHWLSQNTYGFQFSAFSSFLLMNTLSEKRWKKIGAFTGFVLLCGAVAINGSRGSWVGVGISLLIFLLIVLFTQPRKFSGMVISLLLMGSVALTIFASSTQLSQAVSGRLDTFQNLEEEKSFQFRRVMNQKSWRLFRESPLFGVGAGRFRLSSVPLDLPAVFRYANESDFDGKSAHNSYLSFLAENGLVGTIPFAVLLLAFAVGGFKSALVLSRQSQYWGPAIYASFIGMSVHMWVISSLTNTATWFIYGLVAAMIILAGHELKELPE